MTSGGGAMPGNPCPFLRAVAESGAISNEHDPLSHVSHVTLDAFVNPSPKRPILAAVWGIGLIGNGLGPRSLLRNLLGGVRPEQLRGGPLDKRGAGSRILDLNANVVEAELARLRDFAVECTDPETGAPELGLRIENLTRMMDANFARAKGNRRAVDRRLMNGEWPILLRVMGKSSDAGDYWSVSELEALFVSRELPARVMSRIESARSGL